MREPREKDDRPDDDTARRDPSDREERPARARRYLDLWERNLSQIALSGPTPGRGGP